MFQCHHEPWRRKGQEGRICRASNIVFGCSITGNILPVHLKGKTRICLPSFAFSPDWHVITLSSNHGLLKIATMRDYINTHSIHQEEKGRA